MICTWTTRFVFSGLRAVTSELSLPQKWESVTYGFFYMRCTCFKKVHRASFYKSLLKLELYINIIDKTRYQRTLKKGDYHDKEKRSSL